MVSIDAKQLDGPRREIGSLRGSPVFEHRLKGGLHIVTHAGKPIGFGPHQAIARQIAKKREPLTQFNDLAKSEMVDPQALQWLMPKYEAYTDRLVSLYEQMRG